MVECDPSKFEVAGPIPVSRSKITSGDRTIARIVAKRLLGIKKFAVLREHGSGWRRVATYPTEDQAVLYTAKHTEYIHCIQEICG